MRIENKRERESFIKYPKGCDVILGLSDVIPKGLFQIWLLSYCRSISSKKSNPRGLRKFGSNPKLPRRTLGGFEAKDTPVSP